MTELESDEIVQFILDRSVLIRCCFELVARSNSYCQLHEAIKTDDRIQAHVQVNLSNLRAHAHLSTVLCYMYNIELLMDLESFALQEMASSKKSFAMKILSIGKKQSVTYSIQRIDVK